jgi:hypothetical protein
VPLAPPEELPIAERPGQGAASAPHVDGPTLCVGFAIREGSIIATIECDLESPEDCRRLSDRIFRSLPLHDWKADFKAHHIPSRLRDPHVHDTLSHMLARRNKTEARLLGFYENPDGTRRDGNEDEVEAVYKRLNKRYNNINRAMLTVFAQFLIADLPASSPVEGTAFAIGTPDTLASEPPCPYSRIRDHPSPPPTIPVFDPIVIDEISSQALFTHRIHPSFPATSSNAVWAVTDSGATHILIKDSDAHILTNVEYTSEHSGPLAVLKRANGQPLTAIGQGTLNVGALGLTAYIFQSRDLVNNLLGLAPFADRNCTSILRRPLFAFIATILSHLSRMAFGIRLGPCGLSISAPIYPTLSSRMASRRPIRIQRGPC